MLPQCALYCAGQVSQSAWRRCDDANSVDGSIGILHGAPSVPSRLLVKVLGPVSDAMNPSLIVTDDGERDQKAGRGHEFSGDG